MRRRTLSNDERLLFTVFEANQQMPNIVNNFHQFIENFISRFHYNVWHEDIDWSLFIVAGGSVILSLLFEQPTKNSSDIDLFFLKNDVILFEDSVVRLNYALTDTNEISDWIHNYVTFCDLFDISCINFVPTTLRHYLIFIFVVVLNKICLNNVLFFRI